MRNLIGPALILVATLACGGGGGSNAAPASGPTYAGPTTPAAIASVSDGQTLAAAALAGGTTGILDDVAGRQDPPRPAPFLPGLLVALASAPPIAHADASPIPANTNPGGDCGGDCHYTTTTVNNGTYSGYCVYNNYCLSPDGFTVVINGSCDWSQNGDQTTNASETLSARDLQVTVSGKTYLCNLTFAASFTSDVIGPISLDCTYQAPDGKIYWAHNYQVLEVRSNSTLAISGEFYHPDYGLVTVATPGALAYSNCSGTYLPTSGSLQITGANNVTATFTPQDCSAYQVCINNGTQTCQAFNWP
jgi:hypothetical protein